jgi:hypothetical protein
MIAMAILAAGALVAAMVGQVQARREEIARIKREHEALVDKHARLSLDATRTEYR